MPQTLTNNKILAEAVTKMVDSLHSIYPGIKIAPISNYEDEDFTVEILIPKYLSKNIEATRKQILQRYGISNLSHLPDSYILSNS